MVSIPIFGSLYPVDTTVSAKLQTTALSGNGERAARLQPRCSAASSRPRRNTRQAKIPRDAESRQVYN